MSLLDDLLAGYVGGEPLCPEPTPAKAANPAKSEHPCGPEAASGACEGLRISAKALADSQLFAGVRKPGNAVQGQYPCGSSQDSQDSQGLPGTITLDPELTGWNVTLAPDLPAATVAKFKAASEALDRLIAQAGEPADPDRDCWPNGPAMNTGEIERMQARIDLFRRRGLTADLAATMADKLMRRDREGDDRRLCPECSNLTGRRCGNWRAAGIGDSDVSDMRTKLQRCPGFAEIAR